MILADSAAYGALVWELSVRYKVVAGAGLIFQRLNLQKPHKNDPAGPKSSS